MDDEDVEQTLSQFARSKTIGMCTLGVLQLILLLLFFFFTKYNDIHHPMFYESLRDIQLGLYMGFGFLYSFLKKYGISGVSFNLLLVSVVVQCALLCDGINTYEDDHKIPLSMDALNRADISALAVVISMGAILGRTTYTQVVFMGLFEIVVFTANRYVCTQYLVVTDAGNGMFVHAFGAYFGLAVSFMLRQRQVRLNLDDQCCFVGSDSSSYSSDVYTLIGTLVIWMAFPSINSNDLYGMEDYRAIVNTYLALLSSCVTTFVLCGVKKSSRRFTIRYVQNGVLAGGVGIATSANFVLQPAGAILVGIISATLSQLGHIYISQWLRAIGIGDSAGVHNLHGLPGIASGIIAAVASALATEKEYGLSLYTIFPARATSDINNEHPEMASELGRNRGAFVQAGFQLAALGITVTSAIIFGVIFGLILWCPVFTRLSKNTAFNDNYNFTLAENPQSKSVDNTGNDQKITKFRNLW